MSSDLKLIVPDNALELGLKVDAYNTLIQLGAIENKGSKNKYLCVRYKV